MRDAFKYHGSSDCFWGRAFDTTDALNVTGSVEAALNDLFKDVVEGMLSFW